MEDIITDNAGLTEAEFVSGEADSRLAAYELDADGIEGRRISLGCGEDYLRVECDRLLALDDGGVVAALLLSGIPECL